MPASATPGTDPAAHPDPPRPRRPRWLLPVAVLGVAVVLAVLARVLVVQVFTIPTTSMEPTLRADDTIVVEKWSGWFGDGPDRGDVVVFEDPGGWLAPGEQEQGDGLDRVLTAVGVKPGGGHLVKRVVGVAGDVVECCDAEGRVLVNGIPLEEDAYTDLEGAPCAGPMTGTCSWNVGPVPDGAVFVLGDHRADSGDSSAHLCTPMEPDCTDSPWVEDSLVVGTAWAVVAPGGRRGFVGDAPSAFDAVDAAP